MTFGVTLDGRSYPVFTQGRRGWALLPVPPLIEPGVKALEVTAGGTRVRLPVPIAAGAFPSVNIPAEVSQPILSQAEAVQAEAARMDEIFGGVTAYGWTPRSRFAAPLEDDFPRTSPYGSRRTYGNSSAITAHAGEDFSAAAGTPVSPRPQAWSCWPSRSLCAATPWCWIMAAGCTLVIGISRN